MNHEAQNTDISTHYINSIHHELKNDYNYSHNNLYMWMHPFFYGNWKTVPYFYDLSRNLKMVGNPNGHINSRCLQVSKILNYY